MPLEISEIGVRLAVGGPGPSGGGGHEADPHDADAPKVNPEQIVERCVAEVLRVLKQREAR